MADLSVDDSSFSKCRGWNVCTGKNLSHSNIECS
jgi:hypothetical protein